MLGRYGICFPFSSWTFHIFQFAILIVYYPTNSLSYQLFISTTLYPTNFLSHQLPIPPTHSNSLSYQLVIPPTPGLINSIIGKTNFKGKARDSCRAVGRYESSPSRLRSLILEGEPKHIDHTTSLLFSLSMLPYPPSHSPESLLTYSSRTVRMASRICFCGAWPSNPFDRHVSKSVFLVFALR